MLSVTDLHVAYGGAGVLRGASLEVREGETLGLLGRNGMGKTTLVKAICGLRPPTIGSGSIRLDGVETTGWSSLAIARRGVGLVPQGRRVFGSLTVEENLRVVARSSADGRLPAWDVPAVYDFFPRLAERRRQASRVLSGGEQQMLAIGRALVTNPHLLVMDEPTEGLAPAVVDLIADRLRELCRVGIAVLLTEQNVDLALEVSDRIAVLGDAGTVAWQGTAAQLRADPVPLHEHLGV
ncbi:MAG: ABC transporter ATP-binding protein [Nocardioidaceae bacterium]|nr:ABC transporter ATP-binding protein [Nocardioidaceae bacterium]